MIDFTKIFQLKDLKPENKGYMNFYECCDLTKKVYLQYTDLTFLNFFGYFSQKNFMWNTVTIQYNPLIEEEWDEHFKVTCEYGYDFWKTVTFPFLDVE